MMKWVYSSKAGLENKPYHHFLGEWDTRPPTLRTGGDSTGEHVFESKTPGHYHCIRVGANLVIGQYLAELRFRKCEPHYELGVNLKGCGYLFVYKRRQELLMLERYKNVDKWNDLVGED